MKKLKINRKTVAPILAALVGLIAFFVIYGVKNTALNPTNDSWIFTGYDEIDVQQHYSGWLAYRDSEWAFPLGLANNLAVGDGTFITYTDSIPWVGIIFKVFRNGLPKTFQYFGIFTLVCYMLQGLAGYKLVYLKTKNELYSLIGSVFFIFSPILLERAFRHTALAAQFLLLFAMYFYIKHKEEQKKSTYIFMLLLEILAIGIHPYYVPLTFLFAGMICILDIRKKKYWSIGIFAGQAAVTFFFGYLIGALGNGVKMAREGYGYYSMNVNAPINPYSVGGYTWSTFLKVHAQNWEQFDGFNYLGFGMLLLIAFGLVSYVLHSDKKQIIGCIKKYIWEIVIGFLLTIFAISNVAVFNKTTIYSITLPEWLNAICSICRASSRMFWPVYYMLFLAAIAYLYNRYTAESKRTLYIMLGLFLLLQIADIHDVFSEKRAAMKTMCSTETYADNEELNRVCDNAEYLIMDEYAGNGFRICIWALKNHLKTYYSPAYNGNYENCMAQSAEKINTISQSKDAKDCVIVTNDEDTIAKYQAMGLPYVCITEYYGDDVKDAYFFY